MGDTVTDCIFRTFSYKRGIYYTLMESHSLSNDSIEVENIVFKSVLKNSLGTKCSVSEMFPKLTESVVYNGITFLCSAILSLVHQTI